MRLKQVIGSGLPLLTIDCGHRALRSTGSREKIML